MRFSTGHLLYFGAFSSPPENYWVLSGFWVRTVLLPVLLAASRVAIGGKRHSQIPEHILTHRVLNCATAAMKPYR